ncbi:hypothetical protein CRG98_010130 [Punica granatum]|uniref:Uncharacterized protein n=1 Tax=Punica granatum TaxID=22663 RepID=A0A2I0KLY9_PUNGR|nr:hypothetical protein CRG98_010130 [Punica granatum]
MGTGLYAKASFGPVDTRRGLFYYLPGRESVGARAVGGFLHCTRTQIAAICRKIPATGPPHLTPLGMLSPETPVSGRPVSDPGRTDSAARFT